MKTTIVIGLIALCLGAQDRTGSIAPKPGDYEVTQEKKLPARPSVPSVPAQKSAALTHEEQLQMQSIEARIKAAEAELRAAQGDLKLAQIDQLAVFSGVCRRAGISDFAKCRPSQDRKSVYEEETPTK